MWDFRFLFEMCSKKEKIWAWRFGGLPFNFPDLVKIEKKKLLHRIVNIYNSIDSEYTRDQGITCD